MIKKETVATLPHKQSPIMEDEANKFKEVSMKYIKMLRTAKEEIISGQNVWTPEHLLSVVYPHKLGRKPILSPAQLTLLLLLDQSGADFTQQLAADAFGVSQPTISTAIKRVKANVPEQEQRV